MTSDTWHLRCLTWGGKEWRVNIFSKKFGPEAQLHQICPKFSKIVFILVWYDYNWTGSSQYLVWCKLGNNWPCLMSNVLSGGAAGTGSLTTLYTVAPRLEVILRLFVFSRNIYATEILICLRLQLSIVIFPYYRIFFFSQWKTLKENNWNQKKSRIRETQNLLTNAVSSTDIFVSAGVKKGANSIFFCSTTTTTRPNRPSGPIRRKKLTEPTCKKNKSIFWWSDNIRDVRKREGLGDYPTSYSLPPKPSPPLDSKEITLKKLSKSFQRYDSGVCWTQWDVSQWSLQYSTSKPCQKGGET